MVDVDLKFFFKLSNFVKIYFDWFIEIGVVEVNVVGIVVGLVKIGKIVFLIFFVCFFLVINWVVIK